MLSASAPTITRFSSSAFPVRTPISMDRSALHDRSPSRPRKRKLHPVPDTLTHIPTSPHAEPKCHIRTRKKHPSAEGKRRWVHSPLDCSSFKDRFVLVSYNILGDENASKHPDLYHRVDPVNLEWERRKRKICKEISRYNAGILCLQEVDHFDDLAASLQHGGFSGVYKGRTGEANDGCAIFWRENEFKVLHHENIEFLKFGLRNNVAQLCVFRMHPSDSCNHAKESSQKTECASYRTFIVGNIHVLFNPSRGDIKLGQVRLLLEKAHALSQEWGSCPVIIAGDLNSMPQSALYQFLSSSELDIRMHDRRKISAQCRKSWKQSVSYSKNGMSGRRFASFSKMKFTWSEEEILLAGCRQGTTHLQHPLNLFSAYPGVPACTSTRDDNGEPLVTSYHSKFMGTVDYIWHSHGVLPVRVLETLPTEVITRTNGLPSQKWGSDHLALACELAFK